MNNTRQRGPTAKYYGLANKGATCYLNSVLQVLFMTKDFREKITSYSHTPPPTGKKHIDSELQNLFRDLEEHSADTSDITWKLSIRNVFEQHDAAEYYEKILRLTRSKASEIFHGKLINRTKCCGCGKGPEIEAPFWSLPLPLVNNCNEYSVENGIGDFFCSSKISGDNQMYCETCDDKRDADLECEMKEHPQVLVLLLKRFEMIFEYNVWSKINCPVKIPESLTLQENQKYKLYAYVDHFGDLQSGHYIATIRSQDDDGWYIFDDLNVQKSIYDHFQLDPTELSTSVYLLFYQKIQKEEEVHTKAPGVPHGPKANTEQSRLKEDLNIDNNDETNEARERKSYEEWNQKQQENIRIRGDSDHFVSPNNREIRQDKTSKKSQPEGSHYNEAEPRENRKPGSDGFHTGANDASEDAVCTRQPSPRNVKIVNDSLPLAEQGKHQAANRQSTKQAGNPDEENRSAKPIWNTQQIQKKFTKNSPGDDHKDRNRPEKRSYSSTSPHVTQSNQQFHQVHQSSRERRGGSLNRSIYPPEFGAGPGPGSPRGSENKRYYSQDNQLQTFGKEIHGNRMINERWKKNGTREAEKYSQKVRAEGPPPVQRYNREPVQKYEGKPQQCLERLEKQKGRGADTYGIDRRGEAKTDRRGDAKTDRRGEAKTDRRGDAITDQQQAKGNESFRKKSPQHESAALVEGLNNLSFDENPNTFIPVRGEVLETNDEPRRKNIFCLFCIPVPKFPKRKKKRKHK